MSLEVRCFPARIQNENTYVITDHDTGCKAVIDPVSCVGCGVCAKLCPQGAIQVKKEARA